MATTYNYVQDDRLDDKSKNVIPKIEKLLEGFSYYHIEQIMFALLKESKNKCVQS